MKKIIYLFFATILISSCIDSPQAPKWDLPLSVPLLNEDYPLGDLQDDEFIFSENDSFYFFDEGNIDGENLSDSQLTISGKSKSSPIPPTTIEFSDEIPISDLEGEDEQLALAWAEVNQWNLKLTIDMDGVENTNLDQLTVTFQEIINENGTPLTVTLTEPGVIYENILDNYQIGDPNATTIDEIMENLHYTINVQTNNEIPAGELPQLRVFFDSLSLTKMKGLIVNKRVDIDDFSSEVDINYPYGIENAIEFAQASITFFIENEIGLNTNFHGIITAYNDNNETYDLYIGLPDPNDQETIDVYINSAVDFDTPSTTTITLYGNKIANLMSLFPTKLELHDAYFIIEETFDETNNLLRFAEQGDLVKGRFEVNVPFQFIIQNETIRPDTLIEQTISQDNQDNIDDYVQEGAVIFKLKNYMDLGGYANIYMSTSNDTTKVFNKNPEEWIGYENLQFFEKGIVAKGDEEYGYSEVSIALSKEDMNFFKNDTIYIGLEFHLQDSDGQIITIKPSDHIEVIGRLEFTVNVDLSDN